MNMAAFRFFCGRYLVFRESRPFESIGGSELTSVFPPPPRTLLGAVRTAIGDVAGVDWHAFKDEPDHPMRKHIGFGDDLGPLALSGPWLSHGSERLYPVPLFLLAKDIEFTRLCVGQAVATHLGRIRLPELPNDKIGYKPLERAWLTSHGLEAVLNGGVPASNAIRLPAVLFHEESRLGIARDNTRRITSEGLFYQTRHLRPNSDLAIEADITLAEGTAVPTGLVRLGGEGGWRIWALLRPHPFHKPQSQPTTRGASSWC
ncbi:MAG: hypothetical protein IPH09_14410 [bacterium]|nr:hypothetical protein [bacterium]